VKERSLIGYFLKRVVPVSDWEYEERALPKSFWQRIGPFGIEFISNKRVSAGTLWAS